MAGGNGRRKKSPQRRATEKAPDAPARAGAKALIMSGYGINSEMETQEALARAGMGSDIVHINIWVDSGMSEAKSQNVSWAVAACGI